MMIYRFLADLTVVMHVTYVAFVIFGLLAIVVGIVFRWQWIRNFWFRAIHLLMISTVVFEALAGMVCPLTTLENYFRQQGEQSVSEGSFVGKMMHDLLFFDAPAWVFTVAYCLFGGLVLGVFILAPPRWGRPKPVADEG